MVPGRAPRRAMVLAAGLGTRLRPITERLPKPAVPIAGVEPLRWTLAVLAAGGIEEAVVNTHWRPEAIEAIVETIDRPHVIVSHEAEILGTGGGLQKVADRFRGETFVMANGKLLFDLDLAAAIEVHRARAAVATMVLRPHPPQSTYASIEIDGEGRIRRFAGRWSDVPERVQGLRGYVFTGVHVLEPEILEHLPPAGPSCINADGYVHLLRAGRPAVGWVTSSAWFEPSTPGRYLDAVGAVLRGEVPLGRFVAGGLEPFAGAIEREPGVWIHESAVVARSVTLEAPVFVGPEATVGAQAHLGPEVSVEAGARVATGARMRRSVVLPRARVRGDEALVDTVVVDATRRVTRRAHVSK